MIRQHLTEGQIVRFIAEERGISEAEALRIRARERQINRDQQAELEARRAKAGYPQFKPRNDYVGEVRRC